MAHAKEAKRSPIKEATKRESKTEKKERRRNERRARKIRKKTNSTQTLVIATQNVNGSINEAKKEEAAMQMRALKIGIVCGQEGRRTTRSMERWDTGELYIACGKNDDRDVARKKDGNFFILNEEWKQAYVRGGKQIRRYNPRLVTLRLPLQNRRHVYIINAHVPDGDKKKNDERAKFFIDLSAALEATKDNDICILAGDMNACMGVKEGEGDKVCGEYGIQRQTAIGREMKTIAAMFQLRDLITWEKQTVEGTYWDIKTQTRRQLDHIMVGNEDAKAVHKCVNTPMIVQSDHDSVMVHLKFERSNKRAPTRRQQSKAADIEGSFGNKAKTEERQRVIAMVEEKYNLLLGKIKNENGGEEQHVQYKCLMEAVQDVIDSLPRKKRRQAGWCEENDEYLRLKIIARNDASKRLRKNPTETNRQKYRDTRKQVKQAMWEAHNKWLMKQVEDSNMSFLPGGRRGNSQQALWHFVRKLNRGTGKWKGWNFNNIQNKNGVLGSSPAENADNLKEYYEDLFANQTADVEQAKKWYGLMEKIPTNRKWNEPTEQELKEAIREVKNTAPGNSGVTSAVWKALIENKKMTKIMLKTMTECWKTETVPEDWTTFYMTVLEKDGDLTLPKNYRGINMGETMSKVYTTILKKRLEKVYEKLAPEYANGFRKNRGRGDCIHALKETLKKRKEKGLDSYLLLYDVVKCFDRIPRVYIWMSMRTVGIQEKMIRVVCSTLKNAKSRLQVEGEERTVQMPDGTGQGTTLGPTLCNLFLLPILLLWDRTHTHLHTKLETKDKKVTASCVHNFADDTAMIVGGKEEAEQTATEFFAYLNDFGLDLHAGTPSKPESKTVVLEILAKKGKTKDVNKAEDRRMRVAEEKFINYVQKARYLGHTITSDLLDNAHLRERMTKASQAYGAMRKKLMGNKKVWRKVKAAVVTNMLLPTMLDGVEHCTVQRGMMDELTTTYHKWVRTALGLNLRKMRKKRMSMEKALAKMNLQPLHYYVDLRVLAHAGHVQRMPESRLTRQVSESTVLAGKRRKGRPERSHKNQLADGLKRKGIDNSEWKLLAADKKAWATTIRKISICCDTRAHLTTQRKKEFWEHEPATIMGAVVEKKFGSKWYAGEVIDYDIDKNTGGQMWKIRYDDSDEEDCSAKELKQIICLD